MWKPVALLLIVILIGTAGYHVIEGWPFLDCLYMTVITIFTVGFKEVGSLSTLGRIFTIFVILGGAGTAVFTFTKVGEIIYAGGLGKFWRRHRMESQIKSLKDHYIICGHGRMGRIVREKLEEENLPLIVIESDEKNVEELKSGHGCCFLVGDATQEDILEQAGIKRAKGLVALLPTDPDNLYLVMTVKLLNPSLFVLARAMDDEAERKILQIGANKVVSPYAMSGLRIAQMLIRPTVVDFVDLIIRRKELSLYMEEFAVRKDAQLVGQTLVGCNLREEANVIVIAVKKPGKEVIFNPSPEFAIEAGDILLVMGEKSAIAKFERDYLSA
jgi:voltage-gated potassium channel